MVIRFQITHMTDDLKTVTENNIVFSEVQYLTYEQALDIHKQAFKITKGKYGFNVYYRDNGKIKQLHTRDSGKYINTTIKAKDTAEGHLSRIYGVADEQMELFKS